jgi:hypothetical protein
VNGAQGGMKFCWGLLDTDYDPPQRKYYAEAATIDFYTPPSGTLRIYPTTSKSHEVQPVVFGYTPQQSGEVNFKR